MTIDWPCPQHGITGGFLSNETNDEVCEVCDRGIGHEVDMDWDDPPNCTTKCRVCKTILKFKGTQDRECCGHRYVGEDLFRADAYYGAHDDYSDEWDDADL